MDLTLNQAFIKAELANVITNVLANSNIHLFKNDLAVDENTLEADLTEADYDGYAAGPVTWGTATVADDGEVEVVGTVPVFVPTGDTTENQVYGIYLMIGDTTPVFYGVGRFENAPLNMSSTEDSLLVTVRYRPKSQSLVAVVS